MARSTLKTANSATVQELIDANLRTIANIQASMATPPPKAVCPAGWLVVWGQAEIMQKLGIYRIDRENPAHANIPALFVHGTGKDKVEYGATNNATNRALNPENMKMLLRHAVRGTFVLTGEFLVFDADNMAASAQHRLAACFVATLINPELEFHFLLVDGIDPLLVDLIDTGKSRTNKDVGGRHKDGFFPVDQLRTLNGLPYGSKADEARKAMIADATSVCSILYHRGKGADVNTSTSEYSKDRSQFDNMVARFPILTIENRTGASGVETLEVSGLERLVNIVYAWDREQGGAIQKYWGRANFAALVILASNTDNPSDIRIDSTTSLMGRSSDKVTADMPSELAIDLELAESLLRVACDKTGSFAPLYTFLDGRKGRNALDKQYKFGALTNTVRFFMDHKQETTLPATTNEAGEVVSPERTIVTCDPLPGNMVPATPRINSTTGKRNPLDYPHFGGFDCGMVDKKALKDQAVLDEVQDEVEQEQEQDVE